MSIWGHAAATLKRIRRLRDRWVLANRDSQCNAGCSFCCHQQVGALIVEGVEIAFRHPRLAPVETPPAAACALLANGRCSIYAERPISCATLFPAGPCREGRAKNLPNAAPVHTARSLDVAFCRRIRMPWPGPLRLPKAIEVGRALLERGPEAAQRIVEWSDLLMREEDILRLAGSPRSAGRSA